MFDPESFIADARRMGKKASVTMVCFNRWNCTSRSLTSIFKNTSLPHILTVVDNASWDGTREKLQELKRSGKIDRLILLPENRGIAVGKNFGLRASEADWYCCIDNDIEVGPYWLSYLCRASMFPDLGVVGCNVQGFGKPGGLHWFEITHWKTVEGVILDNCPNPGGIYAMSASTFKKLGYFQEISLYGLEDSELHSRQKPHGLRSAYVRNISCEQLPDENFLMQNGTPYKDFKQNVHQGAVTKVQALVRRDGFVPLEYYESTVTTQEVEKYTWSEEPIAFWSVAEHHALAIRPIYNKMKALGKNVVDLFNQPPGTLLSYPHIVSGTAVDVPPSKRTDTIYHFHSLSPYHADPSEDDYKYLPLFKGLMFPGEWWVDKWQEKPEHWAIVGWPKSDLLKLPTDHERTVLYASSMHDFERMKTLRLLIELSGKIGFKLIVKPHYGTEMWYPEQLAAMSELIPIEKSTGDIFEYFHLADVLVSEASGSLWEFMATGRPSIQMSQAERWNRIYPGGVYKASFDTLEKVLEEAFKAPTSTSDWCKKVMGDIDGKATDRAIAFIEEVFG